MLEIVALNITADDSALADLRHHLQVAKKYGFRQCHIVSLQRSITPEHEVSIPMREHPRALIVLYESKLPLFGAQIPLALYLARLRFPIPTAVIADLQSGPLGASDGYREAMEHAIVEFCETLFRDTIISPIKIDAESAAASDDESFWRLIVSVDAHLHRKTYKQLMKWMSRQCKHIAKRHHDAVLAVLESEHHGTDPETVEDYIEADDSVQCDLDDDASTVAAAARKPLVQGVGVKRVLLSAGGAQQQLLDANAAAKIVQLHRSASNMVHATNMAAMLLTPEEAAAAGGDSSPTSPEMQTLMLVVEKDLLDAERAIGQRLQWYFNKTAGLLVHELFAYPSFQGAEIRFAYKLNCRPLPQECILNLLERLQVYHDCN